MGREEDGYITYGAFRNFLMLLPPERRKSDVDASLAWFEAATFVPLTPPVRQGTTGTYRSAVQRWEKLRIVTLAISGGRSLTRPFRDARQFPSTCLLLVLTCTRTPRTFGICPSFKGHFLSLITIRQRFKR
jgi:hypothetical protein